MLQYVERMVNEKSELDKRIEKLKKFVSESGVKLDDTQKHLMTEQSRAMEWYSDILGNRIKYESGK